MGWDGMGGYRGFLCRVKRFDVELRLVVGGGRN